MNYEKSVIDASEALLKCIENAGNFLTSADILIGERRYREALLITMYAGEEIGKILLVFNYPLHSESEKGLSKWKKRFMDHTEKFWFLRNIDEMERGYVPSRAQKEEDRKAKNDRMEISYVDYRDSRFVFPRKITRDEAVNYFEKVSEKYENMKRRHPNTETVEGQLRELKRLPKSMEELSRLLRQSGLKELED